MQRRIFAPPPCVFNRELSRESGQGKGDMPHMLFYVGGPQVGVATDSRLAFPRLVFQDETSALLLREFFYKEPK